MNAKQLADKHGKKKRILFLFQRLFNKSGLSSCGLCGRAWNMCKPHDTPYGEGRGCFPLCEDCWSVLTPAERLPYYKDLVDRWKTENDRIKRFIEDDEYYEIAWEGIKRNVKAGL